MFTLLELRNACKNRNRFVQTKFNRFLKTLSPKNRVSSFLVQQNVSDQILQMEHKIGMEHKRNRFKRICRVRVCES